MTKQLSRLYAGEAAAWEIERQHVGALSRLIKKATSFLLGDNTDDASMIQAYEKL